MDGWISAQKLPGRSASSGVVTVRKFKDPTYVLLEPLTWQPNNGQFAQIVEVPKGFVTDFASIPWPFSLLVRPDGEAAYPAIIHDYLYWEQTRSRSAADQVFKFAMEDFGITGAAITTIYAAVDWLGQKYWDENAKLKAAGEKRILMKFPDDPTVSWQEWKNRPGVF